MKLQNFGGRCQFWIQYSTYMHIIMYCKVSFTICTIVYRWEYRPLLLSKENMQCINMGSEYSRSTLYFGTCSSIDLCIVSFMIIQQKWNTHDLEDILELSGFYFANRKHPTGITVFSFKCSKCLLCYIYQYFCSIPSTDIGHDSKLCCQRSQGDCNILKPIAFLLTSIMISSGVCLPGSFPEAVPVKENAKGLSWFWHCPPVFRRDLNFNSMCQNLLTAGRQGK